MKHYIQFKAYTLVFGLLAGLWLAGCSEEAVVTNDDFGKYEAVNHSYGYIKNAVAPSERLVDLYSTGAVKQLEVGLTKAMNRAVDMKITVDESILTAYNKANNKNFPMLPEGLVTIGQNATVVVPPGYTTAEPVSIAFASSDALEQGTTYVVPLRISTTDADVKLSEEQQQYLFYVIAQGERMDANKSAGYKVVSCMETGDADPRIHCELFLKNEGKPLVDIVVLFSGNLNYNASTGRVYVHMNNSITPILQNRERYIKPLQDMGIKVVLGLLGNHDPAGVAHLEYQTALDFVGELKNVIDAYGLDGFFWDDEYTSANASIPGFSTANKTNASRLIFEAKKAMPDKLNIVYQYSTLYGLLAVDGVNPGDYLDYVISDYGATVYPGSYPGLAYKQGMPRPYELNLQRTGNPSTVVSGGWGGIMVFALGEQRSNWNSYQLPALRNIASTMFNDELYYTGVKYPVEW